MAASAPAAISAAPAAPGGRKDRRQAEPKPSLEGEARTVLSLRDEKPDESIAEVPMPEKLALPVVAPVTGVASRKRRNNDGGAKKKKKPKVKDPVPHCVGHYVDALDKHMLWAEARIIGASFDTQKIRVHFVGWSKSQDLWTDPMSITAHGRYAPRSNADNPMSWNGDMHLFEDMLGAIKDACFGPNAAPTTGKPMVAPLPTPATAKRSHKKKIAPKATTAPTTQKETPAAGTRPVKATPKRAADNPTKQEAPAAEAGLVKVVPKRPAEKSTKENMPPRKRQKAAAPPATASGTKPTAAKPRAPRKTQAPSPSKLPFFRELETKDGKPVDVSAQREEGQDDAASMQNFVESCALVWKEQLRALSV